MRRVPVILFGAGGVGQALLQQIVHSRAAVAARAACHFDVVAVADSRSWRWADHGLPDARLLDMVADKRAGRPLAAGGRPPDLDVVEQAASAGLTSAILVDVTAVDGMEPVLDRALALGYGVVLANKKPLAGPWATAQPYYHHPRLRHESTVGGGQPVIATLRTLLDVNDPIQEITGQLSGSLGYICGRLAAGDSFSAAIAAARELGYTEPDPRDDLGGQDVMRKIMILGRLAGWPLETADISVESLYPAEMASLSVAEFMAVTARLDQAMADRVQAAAARGQTLRYVARVSADGGAVSLQPLPTGSPMAGLKHISFRTGLYDEEPLLIAGKGAGVGMTAAGVLGDMVGLVREARAPAGN